MELDPRAEAELLRLTRKEKNEEEKKAHQVREELGGIEEKNEEEKDMELDIRAEAELLRLTRYEKNEEEKKRGMRRRRRGE
jgi:hypothetical protein